MTNGRAACLRDEQESDIGFLGDFCEVKCKPGYKRNVEGVTCQTTSDVPEIQPFLAPQAQCEPMPCGDYVYAEESEIVYGSESRLVDKATLKLTCREGHYNAGAGLGLTGTLNLVCGPVYENENEPLVTWKLSYVNAGQTITVRAGLICVPENMAVYPKVALTGLFQMTMLPPKHLPQYLLCTTLKNDFETNVSLAIVLGLSTAGGLVLKSDSLEQVVVSACERPPPGSNGRLLQSSLAFDTMVGFNLKVKDNTEAVIFQNAMENREANDQFKRVFSLAMLKTTGVEVTKVQTSKLARSFAYDVGYPDGTQKAIVLKVSSNESNLTEDVAPTAEHVGKEEFVGSMAFIAIVAGSLACCCCCIVILGVCRWRYRTKVDPEFEDAEEESDFEDDPEIEDVPQLDAPVLDDQRVSLVSARN